MDHTLFIKEDLTVFQRYRAATHLVTRKKAVRRMIWISLFPVPVYIYGMLSGICMPFGVLFLPVTIFLFLFVLPYFILLGQVQRNPEKFRNVVVSISDTGFVRSGEGFEYKRSWPEFNGWEETNDFIYLYFSQFEGVAHVIRKGAVREQELPELRKLLEEQLG